MSVEALLNRLTNMRPAELLSHIGTVSTEIDREFENANSDQRIHLLEIHKDVMDFAEHGIAPENLGEFRQVRMQGYHLMLSREAMVGETLSLEKLLHIVDREVDAGRMRPDNELRQTAHKHARIAGLLPAVPPASPEHKRGGQHWFQSFFSR